MVAGIAGSVISGGLIAHPPFSIPGALLLVAATIAFAVGASWTMRKSWDAASWPDAGMPTVASRKRLRRILILQCILAPLLIGGGVWQAFTGGIGWVNIIWGTFLLVQAVTQLRRYNGEADGSTHDLADGLNTPAASPQTGLISYPGVDEQLPKGSPQIWYLLAGVGGLCALGGPILAGSGVLEQVTAPLGILGLFLVFTGLGIAITKERAIKPATTTPQGTGEDRS